MGWNPQGRLRVEREIFYVTDNPDKELQSKLEASGWAVTTSGSAVEAKGTAPRNSISIGLIELSDESLDAPRFCELLDRSTPWLHWIALVAKKYLQHLDVTSAIARCCFDFHTLPVDADRLLVTLGHARGMVSLQLARRTEHSRFDFDSKIIGNSASIETVKRAIAKIGPADAPVLVTGESGAGKELVAKAIHDCSKRSSKPFIAVNCAAIPESLIQSALFGHEKGAFTGAIKRHIGKVESADGGTVFLDEIGDIPLDLQVNLLRFLEEKKIQRVGGVREIEVDVRVIAATHVDLKQAINDGRFREDLYFRLDVLGLRVPPLRDRGADIELLARYFYDHFSSERQPFVKGLSREALNSMYRYQWPGNVRELVNRVRNALIMSENRWISSRDLGLYDDDHDHPELSLDSARATAEKEAIAKALVSAGHNMSEAARLLDITRGTLYRLVEKHGLEHVARPKDSTEKVVPLHRP
jgi:DNA-binding NtrC family response regulator